jgi:predicted lipoprotein with Yx(FWY)xxD motif
MEMMHMKSWKFAWKWCAPTLAAAFTLMVACGQNEPVGNPFGPPSPGNPVLRVADHPEFGEILVSASGMTLYTFAHEGDDEYICEDACSENFPPLVVVGPPIVPPGLENWTRTIDRRPDDFRPARIQVSYRGQPLYFWSRDERPGDTGGHGIAGLWEVARP